MSKNESKVCPCCGAELPLKATACRECGSDEQTGWSEQTYLDGIELENDIDYDDLKEREFGKKTGRIRPLWQILVAAIMVLLFFLMLLQRYF